MAIRSRGPLDALLCLDLSAASRAVIRAYAPLLKELELTYPQYLVMTALWAAEPLTVSQLCAHLSLDSGTLSPLLKRLEAAGLVSRQRNRRDEREVEVTLTVAGRALQQRTSGVCDRVGELFGLNAGELAQLQQMLRRIQDRMEASLESPAE